MAFVVLCTIPGVHGFSSAVGRIAFTLHPRLTVLATGVEVGMPESSRSSYVFNRESLRQHRLASGKRKVRETKNKTCSGKTACKDCPFGGSGCVGGEHKCILHFPNQNYEQRRRAPKKVD